MMGPQPGHPPMHPGPMGGGYPPHPPHPMMGGPPPPHHPHGGHPHPHQHQHQHPHAPPPHPGSPHGFMEDLGNDMGMDIEGLMLSSPPYSTNYPQGFFDSGMQ